MSEYYTTIYASAAAIDQKCPMAFFMSLHGHFFKLQGLLILLPRPRKVEERERRKVGNSRSIQPQAFYKTPVFPKMALLVIRKWRYFVLEGLLDF